MRSYEDFWLVTRAALALLGDYKLAILSNGSPYMLDALVKSSEVARCFADVISVDRVRLFKPEPACYATRSTAAPS
jgi:2-haloacid dehalogenase